MKFIAIVFGVSFGFIVSGCYGVGEETLSDVSVRTQDCPSEKFTKQAMVFDVLAICATMDVPERKFRYASNIAAEWLDNNGDGKADEPRVIKAMEATRPFLIMTESGPSWKLKRELAPALSNRVGQDLSADETKPANGRRDASQEELHHLVMGAGWGTAFPDVFSDQKGSELYAQWELAEEQRNYSYWDPTCNASCKVHEFFYLATAAFMGSSADLHSNEMRLKNRKQLKTALPKIMAIMRSPDYNFPINHWPSGKYAHRSNIRNLK